MRNGEWGMGNKSYLLSPFPIPQSPLANSLARIVTDLNPEPASRSRIAIIGAGITGLAAAHHLHELLPRADLALLEASPRIGGVLETVRQEDFLIERSADNFLTRLPQAIDLCHRLGLADELISTDETRRRAFVVRDGRLLPIPEGFHLMSPHKLGPVLASPILSPLGKLRLLAEPLVPRGTASINLNPDPQTLNDLDESVASFARRRLGREVFERFVQPLVAGIYTADPEKLSMAATMPEFLEQERTHGSLLAAARRMRTGRFHGTEPVAVSDQSPCDASGARYNLFATFRNGITTLVKALAVRLPPLDIHLNTPVTRIWQTNDALWSIDCGLPDDSFNPQSEIRNPQFSFDALILAVPAHAASKLFARVDPSLSAELAAIEYAGCNVVSLGYKRDQIAHPLDGFGFVVPQVERRRIIAASFASQKYPNRAPADSALLRVFIGGALQPELLDLPDSELRRIAIDELSELLRITGQPLFIDIARWPRSMPQYHIGHVARVARIEALAARHPRLAIAGNAYHGVGIPQCIASAEAAAENVAAALT
jgi:oxygen-dependent protoporphyrinogen oxidase